MAVPNSAGGHVGVGHEVAESGVVGPSGSGFVVFGAGHDAAIVADLVGDLGHAHETRVEADHVHHGVGGAVGRGQGGAHFGHVEAVAAAAIVPADDADGGLGRLEVPAVAVVPEDDGVAVGGVVGDAPLDEGGEGGRVAHVGFADAHAPTRRGCVALGHAAAAGVEPVVVARVVTGRAVHLHEDIHVGRRSGRGHFQKVLDAVVLEVVVGVHVDHEGPLGLGVGHGGGACQRGAKDRREGDAYQTTHNCILPVFYRTARPSILISGRNLSTLSTILRLLAGVVHPIRFGLGRHAHAYGRPWSGMWLSSSRTIS